LQQTFRSSDRKIGKDETARGLANIVTDTHTIAHRMMEVFWTVISVTQQETDVL
jgi:hypothetical protein